MVWSFGLRCRRVSEAGWWNAPMFDSQTRGAWTVHPKIRDSSSMQGSVATLADQLVRSEMLLSGAKRCDAEKTVARKAGVLPGTMENLRRGRLKHAHGIGERLRGLLVAQIERQIAALETEVRIARETSFGAVEADVVGAEIALKKARECLGCATGGGSR